CRSSLVMSIGCNRSFSEDVAHMPVIRDPEIQRAFKDLMAADWGELPASVIHDAKSALSRNNDDKAGQEVLKNVFSAAEAVEEFIGIIMNIKMEFDDEIGLSVYQRYATYLDAFGPDESYLRKKVETELGSKMIFLKMRCAGLGSEWGKVFYYGCQCHCGILAR
ncbi:hypothetical protein CISIN_1g0262462mg, partial [Citrus sinensis]